MIYQVGDTLVSAVSVIQGTGLRFVWSFWDGLDTVTDFPGVTKVIDSYGTLPYSVTAVDPLGRSASSIAAIVVNGPPQIQSVTITNNDEVLPYNTTITVVLTDPESQAINVQWLDGITVIGTGNVLVYTVTTPKVITMHATDAGGGTTNLPIELRGTVDTAPVVTAVVSPDPQRIGTGQTVVFTATAHDPEGSPLTFLWTFWDLSTSSGTTTPIGGGQYQNSVTKSVSAETAGVKTTTLQVTDPGLHSTILTLDLTLVANSSPVISAVTDDAPGETVAAGTPVTFTCTATDADGDVINFQWSFNTGFLATGNPVVVPTSTVATQVFPSALTTTFSGVLAHTPILPSTVTVTYGPDSASDDGAGNILASGSITGGTVNYGSGAISVTVSVAGTSMTVQYSYRIAPTLFGTVQASDSLGGSDTAPTNVVTVT